MTVAEGKLAPVDAPLAFVDLAAQYRHLKPEIDRRVQAVLDHGRYINGPEIGELERRLAEFAGAADAIAVSSGTDALLAALMAEGVGPGDAVFLPAFTFPATAEVVVLLGARPVFVDVDRRSFNIDPADLARRLEQVKAGGETRPKGIIPVDLFGRPADYPALHGLAAEHGLFVLADAAQSYGARLGDRAVGTLAEMTAVSFFPAKPLGCYGDGGAILVGDPARGAVLRSIRAHGKGAGKYDIDRIGLNARLDTLQAAVLLPKLDVFGAELEARERLAKRYDAALGEVVTIPERDPAARSAWAQYTLTVEHRDALAAALKAQGIPTAVYYPRPMHLQPAYRRFGEGAGSLANAEWLSDRVLSLPMHPYMSDADADRVCQAVRLAARA